MMFVCGWLEHNPSTNTVHSAHTYQFYVSQVSVCCSTCNCFWEEKWWRLNYCFRLCVQKQNMLKVSWIQSLCICIWNGTRTQKTMTKFYSSIFMRALCSSRRSMAEWTEPCINHRNPSSGMTKRSHFISQNANMDIVRNAIFHEKKANISAYDGPTPTYDHAADLHFKLYDAKWITIMILRLSSRKSLTPRNETSRDERIVFIFTKFMSDRFAYSLSQCDLCISMCEIRANECRAHVDEQTYFDDCEKRTRFGFPFYCQAAAVSHNHVLAQRTKKWRNEERKKRCLVGEH